MMMNYTADQMAKMIVLAETLLLGCQRVEPIEHAPAITFTFDNYQDASRLTIAMQEAAYSLAGGLVTS